MQGKADSPRLSGPGRAGEALRQIGNLGNVQSAQAGHAVTETGDQNYLLGNEVQVGAVSQISKSPLRAIRTPGSVGKGAAIGISLDPT